MGNRQMTVREFKAMVASIPGEMDDHFLYLPEGLHGSENVRWSEERDDDVRPGETPMHSVMIHCE